MICPLGLCSQQMDVHIHCSGFIKSGEGHHPWQGVLDHCHSSEPAEERAIRFLETGGNTWG